MPANPERHPSWKKARPKSHSPSYPPIIGGKGAIGRGGQRLTAGRGLSAFPSAERVLTATRLRTARELWDLLSPTSAQTAGEICRQVAGSKVFVRNLVIERPPSRARWKKALHFSRLGPVIALMYFFYLLVALAITLPVLLVAFCLDLPLFLRSRLLRRQR